MLKKIARLFNKSKTAETPYSFICSCCGETITHWPALAHKTPLFYDAVPDDKKNTIAEISSDFCVIRHPEETNYFIRCILLQDIIGSSLQLNYGLWVSLSEKNFNDYKEHYNEKNRDGGYFGWMSNNLAGYNNTTAIPADVYLGKNGDRPEVVPHQGFDHPFVQDYYNGITMEEAHNRIKNALGK